jgi:hypothetical protein
MLLIRRSFRSVDCCLVSTFIFVTVAFYMFNLGAVFHGFVLFFGRHLRYIPARSPTSWLNSFAVLQSNCSSERC